MISIRKVQGTSFSFMSSSNSVKVSHDHPRLIQGFRQSNEIIPQLMSSRGTRASINCRDKPSDVPSPHHPNMNELVARLQNLHLPQSLIPQAPEPTGLSPGINSEGTRKPGPLGLPVSFISTSMCLHQKFKDDSYFLHKSLTKVENPLAAVPRQFQEIIFMRTSY